MVKKLLVLVFLLTTLPVHAQTIVAEDARFTALPTAAGTSCVAVDANGVISKFGSACATGDITGVSFTLPSLFNAVSACTTGSCSFTFSFATQTNWSVLAANGSGVVSMQVLGKSHLPAAIAYEDESNTFTAAQQFNGGFTVDSTAFTVADATGNTGIAGTLTVAGSAALNGGITVDSTNFTVDGTTGAVATAADVAVNGGDITSTATTLNISPTTTIGLSKNTALAPDAYIGASNYASQTTGWRVTYPGGADFRYLFTDKLHAKNFIADLEMALAGGQIISKSVAMVAQAFTCPIAGGTADLYVRDLPSAADMPAFENNDWVAMRLFTRGGGTHSTLDDNIGGFWDLDETSGTRYDSTTAALDLTDGGSTSYTTGLIGNAAGAFTTTNSLTRADHATFSGGTNADFTLAGWIKLTALNSARSVWAKWQATTGGREYRVDVNASNQIDFFYTTDGSSSNQLTVTTTTLTTGTWYFIAVGYDSVNDRAWVSVNNGTAVTSGTISGIYDGTQAFRVGSYNTAQGFANGYVDNFGIWRKTLSASELTELYNAGAGKAYPFSTGSGGSGNSLTIADCVGQVSSYVDQSGATEGQQKWTFTRGTSTCAGAWTTGTIAVDALVLDYGASGNGYHEVNAIDGTQAVNSPYSQVATWATCPIAANRSVYTRIGNLKGITGTSNEFGAILGKYDATPTTADRFLRLSNTAVEMFNVDFKMYDSDNGSNPTIMAVLNSGNPYFSIGDPAPTAYNTGEGIWMGSDSGTYKFRIGTPGGNQMSYDNGTDTLTVTGTVTAGSGTIGGWSLGTTTFQDAAGVTGLTSAVTGGNDLRIWAGDATASNAEFRVYEDGSLIASSATITGTINFGAGVGVLNSNGITIAARTTGTYDPVKTYRFSGVTNGDLYIWGESNASSGWNSLGVSAIASGTKNAWASLEAYHSGTGGDAFVLATSTDSGVTALSYSAQAHTFSAGKVSVTNGDYSQIILGPSSSYSKYLLLSSGAGRSSNSTQASIVATSGNMHLDPTDGAYIFLNYYSAGGGILIGNNDLEISTNNSCVNWSNCLRSDGSNLVLSATTDLYLNWDGGASGDDIYVGSSIDQWLYASGNIQTRGVQIVNWTGASPTNTVCSDHGGGSSGYLLKCTSSARYKTAIIPAQEDWARVLDLVPVDFEWKAKPGFRDFGAIAESAEGLGLYRLLDYDSEGRPDGLHYEKLALYLIPLVREQRDEIVQLKARVAALEGRQ